MIDWHSFYDGVIATLAAETILLGVAMVIRGVYRMGLEDGRGR